MRRQSEISNAPSHEEFMWEVSQPWKALRYSNFKSIGLTSFKKAAAENELTLYHELQEDEYFRANPHLLEFKKKKYIDPDILAARRAGKSVFTHDLIQDKDYNTFGCKYLILHNHSLIRLFLVYKRFDWDHPMIQNAIRMGSRGRSNNIGPGCYAKAQPRSRDNKGMFTRTKEKFDAGKIPGPGHYL